MRILRGVINITMEEAIDKLHKAIDELIKNFIYETKLIKLYEYFNIPIKKKYRRDCDE